MASTQIPPTFQERDLNYYLRMIRTDYSKMEELQPQALAGSSQVKNIVIVFTADYIGKDQKTLGKVLLFHFIQSIINGSIKPKAIILMNSAVKLACETNESIGKLTILEEQGAKIMVCVSSLEKCNCSSNLNVGYEASMDEICETMMSALKVITF